MLIEVRLEVAIETVLCIGCSALLPRSLALLNSRSTGLR